MATDVQHRTDAPHGDETTMTALVKGIIDDVQQLTRQQFALLKEEVRDDFTSTVQAGTVLGAGVVVLGLGALLLLLTIPLLLEWAFRPDLPLWGAFAIVTGVVLAAGAGLSFAGLKKFQSFDPLHDRAAEALKENVQWLTNPK
ncbi:MAG: phage holin family protein [Gemmataceae bacterium]|nr:phage holin family protein [Gemmataceae bacterium]